MLRSRSWAGPAWELGDYPGVRVLRAAVVPRASSSDFRWLGLDGALVLHPEVDKPVGAASGWENARSRCP